MNATVSYAPSRTLNEAVIETTHGAQAAFNAKGSCAYHPDILLRRKTLTGFKILEKECPRCKIEWEDRRRAALARREASPSYLRPPNEHARPQLQMHPQHQAPNALPVFHPQQPELHPNSPYYQHQSQSGHYQYHHQQLPVSQPSNPQIAAYYHCPSAPSRPLFTTALSQQPLKADFNGFTFDTHVTNEPTPFVPPPRPIAPIPFVPPKRYQSTSTSPLHRPNMAPPRPWVSEPQLNHIRDDEVEVDEADEDPAEADVELDLMTAYVDDDVETILEIMKEYTGSPAIQGVGCKALLKLCNRCDDNANTVLYCGAKEVVGEAYNFFKDSDVNVAGDGFVLLELFKRLESPSVAIPEEPAPYFTPESEKSSLPNLQPIDPLVESKVKPELNRAYQNDDIQSIVSIMGKFTGSSSIQEIGCRALWRLSHRYGKMEIVLKYGGRAVVEDALHYFEKSSDEVEGYGRMILDLSNRTTEMSDIETTPATESASKIPFSSLPRVNSCTERIAVDDIGYFGKNSDPLRVCAMMRWYPGSGTIQGKGCKELWSILHKSECFDELLAPGPTQVIKDAVYYYAGIDNNVDEYGALLLGVMSTYEPESVEVLPQASEEATKDGAAMQTFEVTVTEEIRVQTAKIDKPKVSTHSPISHTLENDSLVITKFSTELKVSQNAPFSDVYGGTCVSLTPRAESDFVDDRLSFFDEPEISYDPNEHKLPVPSMTLSEERQPVKSDTPLDFIHELPGVQTGTAIKSQLPPAFRTLLHNTKNMATTIAVSLANGEKPSAPPLPRVLKMMTRKSTSENSPLRAIQQRRHPTSASCTHTEPAEDLISSACTNAVLAVEDSRNITSRNLAQPTPQTEEFRQRARPSLLSLRRTDPLVERIACNSLKSFDVHGDVEQILSIMRRHPDSMDVQGQGVKKLWEFCFAFDKIDDVLGSSAREIIEDATFYFGETDRNVSEYAPMLINLFS